MSAIPKVIYLQIGDLDPDETDEQGWEAAEEITWCTDKVDDRDIEYVLKSEAEAERDALRARMEAADEWIQQLSDELTLAVDKRNETVANYTHQIVELEDKVKAVDEDADRLAKKHTYRNRVYGETCIYCGAEDGFLGVDTIKHTSVCPITLHRARVEGKK